MSQKKIKALVGCEFSGVVRDALIAVGVDAVSCDLLDSERPGPHRKADIFSVLDEGWDLMVFFWPCTNMCGSGARWWPAKREAQARDVEAFTRLMTYPGIPKIAGENPVGILSSAFRKPDQIVQPFHFGDPFRKTTCLWLKGLPRLTKTHDLGTGTQACWREPPHPDRWKRRSRTYPGFAAAMAEQWGFDD
jgi:hypothetical protein